MLVAKNSVETNKFELEIKVDAAGFEEALQKAYLQNKNKIQVPGFRKGKAPRKLIEKMYGVEVFYEDAINNSYPAALEEAVKEAELELVDRPEVEITAVNKEDGYTFKAVCIVKPEVEVSDYKGIKVTKTVNPVGDAEVSAELGRMQERNARTITVEGRSAEMGDTVVFDFDGSLDGVPFDGGKAEDFSLELGSGQFIPGFEDQIVGHEVGDEFEISVKFPEDYQAEELKGKDATFKIKLHQIKRKELPTLDDEFAKDVSEFDTLDEYKNSLREKLQSDREKQEEMNVENQIFDALIEKVQGEIPEEMYEQEVEESINNFAYRLQSQGLNLETYLKYTGMDVNAIKEQFRPQSEKQLKLRLALEKIAELENLEVSDEAVEEEYEKLAKQYNMEVAQIKNLVAETQIRADLKNQKAIDFVKENASVKAEKPAKKTTRRKSTKKAAEEKTEETAEAKTEE